jgi:excinuclease ABC subunit C
LTTDARRFYFPAIQTRCAYHRLRDEAHRFAIDYHRRLRNRLIRESALDEIPGIGPARKAALLKRFGSVYRLARASIDDIQTVPGVDRVLAEAIRRAVTPAG